MNKVRVGVLALQGAVHEHLHMLGECGADTVVVKKPTHLEGIDGLIIPGGESTTIGKLMVKYGFVDSIKTLHEEGLSLYGTCAGLILLAKGLVEGDQPLLELMDIKARRNAFGRQRESFETELDITGIEGSSFRGVFIRAPWIEKVGENVEVMAKFDEKIVMAKEANLLVSAFHPELTADARIHKYFIEKVVGETKASAR